MTWLKNKKKHNFFIFLVFLFVGITITTAIVLAISIPKQETDNLLQKEDFKNTEKVVPQTSITDQYTKKLDVVLQKVNDSDFTKTQLMVFVYDFLISTNVPEKYMDRHVEVLSEFIYLCKIDELTAQQLKAGTVELLDSIIK